MSDSAMIRMLGCLEREKACAFHFLMSQKHDDGGMEVSVLFS